VSLFDRSEAVLLPLVRPSNGLRLGELLEEVSFLEVFFVSIALTLGWAAFLPFGADFGAGAGWGGGRGR
jgi:hypothetical protein